ncbi:DUF1150 family protein [Amaricoccus sp.]|uniref:DUF1150 family protein n=1 Tax=Amaricoccus sp. TaxID=1872485 RepID=UPI0026368B06|nr:DUF1150 family protein [Amaricoccus sp.]HRO12492.1 DUF1150 family protein [Amaricoccus sp.]
MTDFPSLPADEKLFGDKRIVYVREVKTADLPEEIRAQTTLDHLYAIHAPNGQVLALVPERAQAFVVARQNEFSPVSVH